MQPASSVTRNARRSIERATAFRVEFFKRIAAGPSAPPENPSARSQELSQTPFHSTHRNASDRSDREALLVIHQRVEHWLGVMDVGSRTFGSSNEEACITSIAQPRQNSQICLGCERTPSSAESQSAPGFPETLKLADPNSMAFGIYPLKSS